MESLKFKEKLGNQVLLISVISLIVTVVLILSTTIFMIKDYNDGILTSRAHIGTSVLEKMISDKSELCRQLYQAESDNLKTLRLMFFGNVEDLDSWYQEKYGEEKGMFFLAVDPDGNTIYASPEYTFKNFDNARFTQEEIDGIVKCDNKLLVMYNKPVAINGKNYGMVFGYNLENESLLEETKEKTVCDVTLFRDNMRMMSTLIDPETGDRIIGTPMGEDIAKLVLENQEPYSGKTKIIGNPYYVSYVPMYDYQKKLCGAYFAGSDATEANGKFTTVVVIAIVLSVAAVVIVTLLTKILISKNVIKPIEAVSAIAREMAQGRLKDTEVEYQFAKSEIGNFAKDLSTTRTVISQYIEDISRILKAMGEGDFTNETSVEYIGDFKSIQSSMEEIVSNISGIIQNIDYSSGGVKSGAAQIADGSQILAQGTTE